VTNDKQNLRAVHAQVAVVRMLTGELQREDRGGGEAGDLRAQAIEESARLVSVLEELSKARSDGPPKPEAGVPEHAGAGTSRRPRVLVVEDDGATLLAIARGLAPEYEVVTATDGVEGLKAASEGAFDAIVSDVQMPRMDGIEMVKRIRELRAAADIPVIFLTGETSPARVVAGFSAGGTSYLVKPVDLDLLDQELRLALDA
jgi:CheY-like chemotaxis protein